MHRFWPDCRIGYSCQMSLESVQVCRATYPVTSQATELAGRDGGAAMSDTELSLVGLKGDRRRADTVYRRMMRLDGADVADCSVRPATRPHHVNIDDVVFFFFQAEDGIRDLIVTGVQTCALPISGLPGLNFAYIGGLVHYHSATDNLAAVDEGSVQHQGSYALALARHFGNLDLTKL